LASVAADAEIDVDDDDLRCVDRVDAEDVVDGKDAVDLMRFADEG